MKNCKLCGEGNQVEFYTSRNTRCKSCVRAKQIEFNNANPEYLKAKNQRRRARLVALPNDLRTEQWKATIEHFGGGCFLTGSTENVSLEHAVPLHVLHMGTTVGNVLPMDNSLNMSKGGKNLLEWFNGIDATLAMHRNFDKAIEYLANLNGLSADDYIDFIYWCDENKRTEDEVKSATKSSIEMFHESRL